MTALHVAVWIVAAIVLGTCPLCLGLAIGWNMGRRAGAVVQPVDMQPFVSSVEMIRGDLGELTQRSRDLPLPDQEFAALLARLTLSLDELHRSLSSRMLARQENQNAPAKEASPASQERSHSLGAHAVGNARILEWFSGRPLDRSPLVERNRFPYAVRQPLAPRTSEALPRPQDFAVVQCHDISPREIRYIVEDRPKEDEVVIGLGIPRPIKHVLARVEDYRSVYMYGRVGFLVTASFVQVVDDYACDATSHEEPQSVG